VFVQLHLAAYLACCGLTTLLWVYRSNNEQLGRGLLLLTGAWGVEYLSYVMSITGPGYLKQKE
jgi:hypothetical protein